VLPDWPLVPLEPVPELELEPLPYVLPDWLLDPVDGYVDEPDEAPDDGDADDDDVLGYDDEEPDERELEVPDVPEEVDELLG